MNTELEKPDQTKWQERIWVMAVAGQAGLFIAFPVILGVGIGILLDRQFNTIILFTVLFSMAGFGAGAFLVYRWVKTSVQKRLENKKKEE
ncbi:MAG: AtpZ/AtpI family protein [Anaerolineales bacterium]|nr:AtpZ/AtpI family protein [Anaerolineales bacterium]